jgi:hypothetical protein
MPIIESDEVLLESPAVLARLLGMHLATFSQPPGRRAVRLQAPTAPGRPRQHRSRACSCGSCGRCRDNARWNRIFDEKFADPSYYGSVPVRHNSSLAGI